MEDAAGLDKGLTGTNQVLYCLSRRGPEYDLLPWMRKRSIPLMAYSPLDQGGLLGKRAAEEDRRRGRLHAGATGARLGAGPARRGDDPQVDRRRERVKENFGALDVKLSPQMLAELDRAFPPPKGKQSLEML